MMGRVVDTELFHPRRRDRPGWPFTIGYVGRITVEKNVHALVEIEQELQAAGVTDYRFLIVGQGAAVAAPYGPSGRALAPVGASLQPLLPPVRQHAG